MSDNVDQLICQKCGKEMSFVPEYAGMTVACPFCRQVFTMPAQDDTKQVPEETSAPVQVKPPSQQAPKAATGTGMYIIYEPPRPATIAIWSYMGIFICTIALLALAYEVTTHFWWTDAPYKLGLLSLNQMIGLGVGFLAYCVFFIGLLYRQRWALWLYALVTLSLVLGLAVHTALRWSDLDPVREMPFLVAEALVLVYLLLGLLLLMRRRVRQWLH